MRTYDYGMRIKLARMKAGLTQEQLAEKVGYTKQTISNWENGKSRPSLEDWIMVKEILGIEESPSAERKKNMDTIKPLRKIDSVEEMDETIEEIIKRLAFSSPFEKSVNFMLKKTLWVIAANLKYVGLRYRHIKKIGDTDFSSRYFDWDDVCGDLETVFLDADFFETGDVIKNKLAAVIYNRLNSCRKFFYESIPWESNESEQSEYAHEMEEPDYSLAFNIVQRAINEADDLKDMFPYSGEENAVITEFRRGIMELHDFLG